MFRTSISVLGATILSTAIVGCGGKSSPSGPSGPSQSDTSAIAETVGSVTMSALFTGGQQAGVAGVGHSAAFSPQASAGQNYGSASCPSGGRVDLIYVREYVPANGAVDTSALKAVFAQCALASGGSSVQLNGDLGMSGMYNGASQPVSLHLSGTLTTSSGGCAVDGSVALSGSFTGTTCGMQTNVKPPPRSPAALAAVANYALSILGGSSLPRVVVTQPCIGSMDTGSLALRSDGTYEIAMRGSFVCANGPGPNVSYSEAGTWAMHGNMIVFSTINTTLFNASAAGVNGSAISMDLDVPSSAPNIPPTRMSATFTR
jgi:hypothetical protein